MNDLYSVLTGLSMHAYEMAGYLLVIGIPATLLIRAFHGHSPL